MRQEEGEIEVVRKRLALKYHRLHLVFSTADSPNIVEIIGDDDDDARFNRGGEQKLYAFPNAPNIGR
jgi:hypothetical protein